MQCLFKALFVLKAIILICILLLVNCDFLDLLGLRKAGVAKKSRISRPRYLARSAHRGVAILGTDDRELPVPAYRSEIGI